MSIRIASHLINDLDDAINALCASKKYTTDPEVIYLVESALERIISAQREAQELANNFKAIASIIEG